MHFPTIAVHLSNFHISNVFLTNRKIRNSLEEFTFRFYFVRKFKVVTGYLQLFIFF